MHGMQSVKVYVARQCDNAMKQYYKVAGADGFDFHRETVNYRENINGTV
jgi:hypothetical protein